MRTRDLMRAWLACAALVATLPAMAQSVGEVKKTVEASMLVNGQIEITPQGAVKSYALDKEGELAPEVKQLLSKAIPLWTFDPVERNGKAVAARSKMNLRLVARQVEADRYEMSIRSAQFDGDPQPGETVGNDTMRPPRYPKTAAQHGVGGTVYLLLQVGRDGKVKQAAAEQTNLRVVDREQNMRKWRTLLETAAIESAKHWTFVPPTKGESANDASWQVRIPVSYWVGIAKIPEDTEWQSYVPGPRNVIPWAVPTKAEMGVDAGGEGQLSQVGAGLQLKTPLNANAG